MIILSNGFPLYNVNVHSIKLWNVGMNNPIILDSDFSVDFDKVNVISTIYGGIETVTIKNVQNRKWLQYMNNIKYNSPNAIFMGSLILAVVYKGIISMGVRSDPEAELYYRGPQDKMYYMDKFQMY